LTDWPDWSGRCVAIIASGPSVKKAEVAKLRGVMPVLAIKKNVELAPWADIVYGCDHHWWRSVVGLRDFKGLKLAYDASICGSEYGIRKVDIPDIKCDRLVFDKTGSVGSGGNSGFQALNLAAQFGAKRILLLGFDMHGRSGEHWYGRNNWGLCSNPTEDNYRRWRAAFEGAAKQLTALGVEVVNVSQYSDLKCFPKMSLDQALTAWGFQNAA
jgi:hypothetical protein